MEQVTRQKREKIRQLLIQYGPVLVVLLYIVMNGALILHHENWRDEAQAWEIAKRTNLAGLFTQLRYEGHPCLWYLILIPFAKLGLPFAWMGFISLAVMTVGVWLLVKKAPFSWPVKLILVFSSFFVYYYPVVSRSYCLIPALLAVLAVLYPERKEKPICYGVALALLTQTHIMIVVVSVILSGFWLLETLWAAMKKTESWQVIRKNLIGLGISLFSGLFLIWELWGSTNTNSGMDIHISSTISRNLYRINLGTQWGLMELFGTNITDGAWAVFRILILLAVVLLLVYSWKEALVFAGAAGCQILMFTYIYLASAQKAMMLAHELIFVLWLILDKKRELPGFARIQKYFWQILIAVLALLASQGHLKAVQSDMVKPYSSSKEMAAYIETQVPDDIPVIATSDLHTTATAAYLKNREIWYPVTQAPITYSVWNDVRRESISYEEAMARVREQYPDAKECYLLCGQSNNIDDLENWLPEFQEVYCVDSCIVGDESATLYLVSLNTQ